MKGAFSFEFFPLKAGTAQGKLEFTSADLGFYQYDVELRALPAGPEKALNFQIRRFLYHRDVKKRSTGLTNRG